MTTAYPGALDSFTNPTGVNKLSDSVGGRNHAAMHADINDAMEAVQAKLGDDTSPVAGSIEARLRALPVNVKDYGAIGDDATDGSVRLYSDAAGSAKLQKKATGTWIDIGSWS